MSPKRRKPIRLSEDCIHGIAQTLGITITPEAAKLLAPNAEYRLRELIRSSKSYMRHSKRSRLTTRDVSRAHKMHFGKSLLGHHGHTGPSGFVQVANDVFVEADSLQIQTLRDIYTKPLPRLQTTALGTSFLTTGKPMGINTPQAETESVEKFVNCMRSILVSRDEPLLDATVRNMPMFSETHMTELLVLLQELTHSNATQSGDTIVLGHVLRLICALFTCNRHKSEMFNDDVLPMVLTCLLGRHLGDGDQWELREQASSVLSEWVRSTADNKAVLRVVKTIVSCLTDGQAPIETIFGAVHGLSAMGTDVFNTHFMPHLPTLLESLRQCVDDAKDEMVKKEIEERVLRLSQSVAQAVSKLDTRRVSEVTSVL